jgi:hypothetical protein
MLNQELIWQVAHNVDLEGAKATPQWVRSPYLEFEVICPDHAREMMQVYHISNFGHTTSNK